MQSVKLDIAHWDDCMDIKVFGRLLLINRPTFEFIFLNYLKFHSASLTNTISMREGQFICQSELYPFEEHIHRFAVWTAARAVARNFTNSQAVNDAIASTKLREFAEGKSSVSSKTWKEFHVTTCRQIIDSLGGTKAIEPSYGRAAKIIAIYLKTAVISRNRDNDLRMNYVHAPIDSILLTGLYKCHKVPRFRTEKWTKLTETEYWSLITLFEEHHLPINWELEKYWNLTTDNTKE